MFSIVCLLSVFYCVNTVVCTNGVLPKVVKAHPIRDALIEVSKYAFAAAVADGIKEIYKISILGQRLKYRLFRGSRILKPKYEVIPNLKTQKKLEVAFLSEGGGIHVVYAPYGSGKSVSLL